MSYGVYPYSTDYETVAASQTNQILGGNGHLEDVLERFIIIPASVSPGAVTFTDGNGSAITVLPGGASSLTELKPITVELGLKAKNATTPGFRVTTGGSVSVIAVGKFL